MPNPSKATETASVTKGCQWERESRRMSTISKNRTDEESRKTDRERSMILLCLVAQEWDETDRDNGLFLYIPTEVLCNEYELLDGKRPPQRDDQAPSRGELLY